MAVQHDLQQSQVGSARAAASGLRRGWARALRIIGTVSLASAVLVGAISYWQLTVYGRPMKPALERFTLIVGDWFPTLWELEIAAIAAGITALIVAAMIAPAAPNHRWRAMRIGSIWVLTILVVLSSDGDRKLWVGR